MHMLRTCYIHVITTRRTDIPADRSLLLEEILLREDKVEGDLVTLSLLVHEDINDEAWLVDWVLEEEEEEEEEAGSSRLLAKVKLLVGWWLTEEEAESPVLAEAGSPVLAEEESPVLAEAGH